MWQPATFGDQVGAARRIAADVAERLADPMAFRAACVEAERSPAAGRGRPPRPHALGRGEAGLALAYGYLARCEDSGELRAIGRRYLEIAARDAAGVRHLPLGLFEGLAGVGAAALSLAEDPRDYSNFLAGVDATVLGGACRLAGSLPAPGAGAPFAAYDLISGLCGVCAYLLARTDQPQVAESLPSVIQVVADRTNAGGVDGAWHVPAAQQHDPNLAARHPEGVVNCGMAHGVPGVLAMLALARSAGLRVRDLDRAIAAIADWLLVNRTDDGWGANWPTNVPRDGEAPSGPTRAGWCYGSPGVARALHLAGRALDEAAYVTTAREAMEAVARRPENARRLQSPTFCHGRAGLLQVLLRFHHDVASPLLGDAIKRISHALIEAYDPASVAGYRAVDGGGAPVDDPSLLNGGFGVVLVLRAATSSAMPDWDRFFLLA